MSSFKYVDNKPDYFVHKQIVHWFPAWKDIKTYRNYMMNYQSDMSKHDHLQTREIKSLPLPCNYRSIEGFSNNYIILFILIIFIIFLIYYKQC